MDETGDTSIHSNDDKTQESIDITAPLKSVSPAMKGHRTFRKSFFLVVYARHDDQLDYPEPDMSVVGQRRRVRLNDCFSYAGKICKFIFLFRLWSVAPRGHKRMEAPSRGERSANKWLISVQSSLEHFLAAVV